jgi:pimeloyl-ACP methyl ester carboxylesterase
LPARTFTEETLGVGDVSVRVLSGGRGEPLLFLHGAGGAGMWLPAHEKLAERFRVIAPVCPGFGGTPRPDWLDTIEDATLHHVDLMEALGVPRAAVIGVSIGGWMAADLASRYPERVTKLVLVGASGLHVPEAPIPDIFAMPMESLLPLLFEDMSQVLALMPGNMDMEFIEAQLRERTTLAHLAWRPFFNDPKLPRRLGRVKSPALLIWGEMDRFTPVAHGKAYERLLAGSRLVVIPNCGHVPPVERADEFCAAVIPFLAKS